MAHADTRRGTGAPSLRYYRVVMLRAVQRSARDVMEGLIADMEVELRRVGINELAKMLVRPDVPVGCRLLQLTPGIDHLG